jgi:catechol 2,3-dioxygenase-like lactoylglutathione lyase family enzyme
MTETRPTKLNHLVVEVPDPSATASFLETGLHLGSASRADDVVDILTDGPYASGAAATIMRLRRGPEPRLLEVVFEAQPSSDMDAVATRLLAAGVSAEPVAATAIAGPGLAFSVGGQNIALAMPASESDQISLPPSSLRPRRLGHVNLTTPEPQAIVRALIDGLGLRLSEQIGEGFYFLRVTSEHHNIGVRTGAAGNAHHIALEVHGWDSYRVLCDHLAGLGHTVEYGPGRHGPGRNLFVYLRDPSSGLRFELFSDMAHVADESTYEPPRWSLDERHKTVNIWGPGPPESFLS